MKPPYSSTALLISSELEAATSPPGTGAGPSFWESLTAFQSLFTHVSSTVQVFHEVRTGSVDPAPDIPISPMYQTETLAVSPSKDSTFVPTGTVRETKMLPCGAFPSASSPSLSKKSGGSRRCLAGP